MSYKTGGLKTRFIPPVYTYGPDDTYTIYTALESCSDIRSYVIYNDKTGEEVDLSFGSEDDCADGAESLIDVMYILKHNGPGVYKLHGSDIVIEEMTKEEILRVFKHNIFIPIKHVYLDEQKPFTIKWLKENIDLEDKSFKKYLVQIDIEDKTTDGKDAGCIDIIVGYNYYWCLSRGTTYKEWLVTASNEFRNDAWIPSVKTIEDFKRLFRVATGFDLPLKKK